MAEFTAIAQALQTLIDNVNTIATTVNSQQLAYSQLSEATTALSDLSVKHHELQAFVVQQQANAASTSSDRSQLNHVNKAFSNVKLPLFEGNKDKSQLDTWLFQLELYFLTIPGLPDDQKVLLASMQLRSNAAQWFRAISKTRIPANPWTWALSLKPVSQQTICQ